MVKIECMVCHREGTLQKLSINYYRVKHYREMKDGKPQFDYHQQTKEYAEQQLALKGATIIKRRSKQSKKQLKGRIDLEIDPEKKNIDLETNNVDLEKAKNCSINQNKRAGRLAWLGHWLYEPKVAGSSPARPTNQHHSRLIQRYSLDCLLRIK